MLPSILFLSAVFVGMAGVTPGGVAMSTHRLHRRAVTDGEPSASSSPSDLGKPLSSAVLEAVKQDDNYAIHLSEPAVTVYNPSKPVPPLSLLFAKDMKEKRATATILVKQDQYANITNSASMAFLNLISKESYMGTLDCTFEEQQLSSDWMNKLYTTDEHQPSLRLAASLTFHLNTPKGIRQCYYTVVHGDSIHVWDGDYTTTKTVQLGLEAIGKAAGCMAELDKHTKNVTVSGDMLLNMYLADKAGQPVPLSTSKDQLDQSLGGVYMPLLFVHNTDTRNDQVTRSITEFFDQAFDSAKDYLRKGHKIGAIAGTGPEDSMIQQQINAIRAVKDVQPKTKEFVEWINQLLTHFK